LYLFNLYQDEGCFGGLFWPERGGGEKRLMSCEIQQILCSQSCEEEKKEMLPEFRREAGDGVSDIWYFFLLSLSCIWRNSVVISVTFLFSPCHCVRLIPVLEVCHFLVSLT
jgi:hypothetical protein